MKILTISIALYCTLGCNTIHYPIYEPEQKYNTCKFDAIHFDEDCTLVA